MNNQLTTRAFWQAYWESKSDLVRSLDRYYELGDLIETYLADKSIRSAIELGGFPGYYATLLRKHYAIDTTLLDYFVHPPLIEKLLQANDLSPGAIRIIEADLFSYTPTETYDLVISCGLIEHFEDLEDILARHLTFVPSGGHVFITLPNFQGINGWIQKTFDRENYDKHNIRIMDKNVLRNAALKVGMEDVHVFYFRRFSVWLEKETQHTWAVRALVRGIWFLGKLVTRIFPIDSRLGSPYLVIQGKKR